MDAQTYLRTTRDEFVGKAKLAVDKHLFTREDHFSVSTRSLTE